MGAEILEEKVLQKIRALGTVDLVVGIPSLNNGDTIAGVVETFATGINKYYPGFRAFILNSDGGSTDDTQKRFYEPSLPAGIERISTQYKGTSGKGSALRTVFEAACLLNPKVVVVTDSDCRTNDLHWVWQLVQPVYEGQAGFVTPLYIRDKHDATITNGLIYPLTRALYGRDIRQPIGGDFAFSGGLAPVFANEAAWERFPEISTFGVDIWMTTTAVCEGIQVCQTSLGQKIHQPKEPGKDLQNMFRQVVGTAFDLAGYYDAKWMQISLSQPVGIFGEEPFGEIEDVMVNSTDMLDQFYEGYRLYKDLWKKILSGDSMAGVHDVRNHSFSNFIFPVDLWAKIVYDFATYYHFHCKDVVERQEVLTAMIPFYLGRTASYVRELAIISDELADAFVRGCAHVFERLKPYFLERWTENLH